MYDTHFYIWYLFNVLGLIRIILWMLSICESDPWEILFLSMGDFFFDPLGIFFWSIGRFLFLSIGNSFLIHGRFLSDPLGISFCSMGDFLWSIGDFFLIHGRFLVCNSRPNCLRFIRRRDDTWTGLQTTTNLTELKFLLLLLLVHLICGKFALIFNLGLIFILQTICGGCLSSWIKQVHLCKRMWWLYESSIC